MYSTNIFNVTETGEENKFVFFSYLLDTQFDEEKNLTNLAEKLSDYSFENIYIIKRHIRQLKKKFKNTIAIIKKAERQLAQHSKGMETKYTHIHEDWIDYFIEVSQNTSADNVQEIWARLLVAEQIKENSVPKRLLYILSLMDSSTVRAFTRLCSYTVTYRSRQLAENVVDIFPLLLDDKTLSFMSEFFRYDSYQLDFIDKLYIDDRYMNELEELGLIKRNPAKERYISFFISSEPIQVECYNNVYKTEGVCIEYDKEYYYLSKGQGIEYTVAGETLFKILEVEPYPSMETLIELLIECYEKDTKLAREILHSSSR